MAPSLWSKDTVAVVTGGNRGIGYEIVRLLAEQGLTVVLTARDKTKGQAAVDSLSAKGLKTVVYHQLDASDSKSVDELAAWLKAELGGIDILVNNAAVAVPKYDYETTKYVIDTNYFGVKDIIKKLLPLFKPSSQGARIINLTSRMGLYERLPSESLKQIFRDEDSYTEELADSLAAKYLDAVKAGRAEQEGWIPRTPGKEPVYSESKLFLNLYSSALARSLAKSQPADNQILIASTCPGVTRTDMYEDAVRRGFTVPEGYPVKTAAEGGETAVWLALLPVAEWEGKSGKLFAENTEYLFGWKNPPVP